MIMTTAIKLNPRELLSRLAESNSSGCLKLDTGEVSWKIYLQQGDLKYVDCSIQLLDQLKYYLHYLGWKKVSAALKSTSYLKIQNQFSQSNLYTEIIAWLLKENHLDLSQSLELIKYLTKDAFMSALWLDSGYSSWYEGHFIPLCISPELKDTLSLEISECLQEEQARLQRWQNCSVQLLSVHQRPYFNTGWEQKSLPIIGSLDRKILQELSKVMRGSTSIRQLSLLLQKDELDVAQILSPYIDSKIIYLRDAQPPLDRLPNIPKLEKNSQQSSQAGLASDNQKPENSAIKVWKIVCVDDSPTILKEIQRFLNQEKFEIIAIDDPIQAVSKIFRIKPDLILLDITMPKISGYKLCGLLRNSEYCNDTPIIMVTGNTGFIDKARAKIAGATDYFTKPFTQEGLMNIVETHLK